MEQNEKQDAINEETEPVEEETAEEQAGEEVEQTDEAEAIEKLTAKITDIDAQIEQYRVNAVETRKKAEMRKYDYSDDQIEKYLKFIEGETNEEIRRSIIELIDDLPPANVNYFGDPSLNNGASAKPKTKDASDVGQSIYKRIKNKVFPGSR